MESAGLVRTADERELAFREWGPVDGRPLFVLHGVPGSRFLRHVGGEYERQSLHAITYDRPGYGGSSRLRGRTVAQSAADIATIADHLGVQRFAVVGISGGGPSALATAAAMPDRVTRCATIVGLGPYDADDLDFFSGMDVEAREEWACAQEGESCLTGAFYQGIVDWAESLEGVEALPEPIRRMLIRAFREALVSPDGMVDDYASFLEPWGFDLAAVVCPTRVLIAREDSSVPPAHGHWLMAHLPDAVAVVVDGGHLGPREAAEEELLGWLGDAL